MGELEKEPQKLRAQTILKGQLTRFAMLEKAADEGAFRAEEEDDEETIDYKNKVQTLISTYLENTRKQLESIAASSDVRLLDRYAQQLGELSERMLAMGIAHEEMASPTSIVRDNLDEENLRGLAACLHHEDQRRTDFDANPTLYISTELKVHQRHFLKLLETLVVDFEQPLAGTDQLDAAERKKLLVDWNATAKPYPEHQCIHQLFAEQVERTPAAPALIYEDQEFSYVELNSRANQLANQLTEWGVQVGDFVATLLERSIELVIAQIAILKVGAAYVPIDLKAPVERQSWMLSDCAARLLITHAQAELPVALTIPTLRFTSSGDQPGLTSVGNPTPLRTSLDTAYVMYTSGSTGTPKGVLVPHRGITRLVINNGYADIGTDDRLAFAANPAFDASTFEVWAPLLNGGSVVIIDTDTFTNPHRLADALTRHKITALFLTSVLFNQYVFIIGPALAQLKYLLSGGDQANLEAFSTLLKHGGPAHLINCYGPTESTTFATTYDAIQLNERLDRLPIGRPIANTTLYLLNAEGHPVPLGAIGELYIGGAGVANGYLNRPELTAERFLPDPFSKHKDARMYKTGDLARYLPDGNLEFLGRNDHQVKIRGFRIEPGEIEARLAEHPQVRDAVVIALGEGNDKRLVAYVVAKPDEQLAHTLRAHLAARLSEYMVPAAFVRLDALPLTPNGKLDRKALPAPDEAALARQAYEAPQGEREHTLATIWTELLVIERISRHDNFFALGGHSLLAVQLIERLRHLGLTLSVRALFATPTLSVLAQSLGQHQEVVVPPNRITPDTTELSPELLPLIQLTQADIDRIVEQTPGGVANIQDIYALSPLQDGILFHHLLASEGDPYLLITQMAFANRALLDRYLEAVQQVVQRHDVLRTAFVWEQLSMPAQVVWRHAPLLIEELALDPENGPIAEQLLQRFDPRRHRMDLTQAPLLRFAIAQDDDGRWLLVQLMHHLIGDHAALDVMDAEVRALIEGRGDALLPAQPFRNLVAQVRLGANEEAHERFFTGMLAEVEEPTLPFGLSEVHRDGSQVAESHRMLPQDLNDRLRAQAKRLNVSLASLCHLAWAQVLARTSGQQRVVFGTVLFGRMQGGEGSDRALGLFINTLPLRIDLGEMSVEESVRDTHVRLAALLEHEHASLALAQRCSSVPAGPPLFSALLNYVHNTVSIDERQTLPGIEWLSLEERTNYPFALTVEDFGTTVGLIVQAVQPFDPARICSYMQEALQSLAKALEHTPTMPVHQLEVLPLEERELLLQTWNATTTPYPAHQCIHQLFEEQVERTLEATALVYEDQVLSYVELNARANRLAHQLIELGVQADTRVAICVERSPAMVVGLLAILKAGGAYVPLDPAYPSERLTHVLRDAAPAILLADKTGCAALDEAVLASLTVLDPNSLPPSAIANPQPSTLTSGHLAYVIYTSGSTGVPKGVMIEHQGVVNFALAQGARFNVDGSSRVLQFASVSFDASVFEIFMALVHGASLYLTPDSVRRDRHGLWDYLTKHAITHALLPPALLQEGKGLPPLNSSLTLVLGGEAPSAALLANLSEHITLFNAYGPTETTVCATLWRCSERFNSAVVPIGKPIANTRLYVLDANQQPVPLGAIGELYIGGEGIARGYLNHPELTAERFVPNPFSKDKSARMYKTGDLVRYLCDGNLEFLGRNDHQIKIRGFRIESGDIEARLAEHPQVREAVVLTLGEGNSKRLIAYVVAQPNDQLAQSLREHLALSLPEYMVPAAFVSLDAFPLTPNGKLDRKALPAPDTDAFARQAYEAPQGEIEIALASIWIQLLKVEQVGRHDNFFALGGHSLLAVQMIERLRRIDLSLSIRALFDTPTLSALAQSLGQQQEVVVPPNLIRPEITEITPELLPLIQLAQADINHIVEQTPGRVENIQDIYALSPLQDGILFHHLMAREGDPYLGINQMAFASRALLDRYLEAVGQVVQRHDILRTAFIWEQLSTPAQVVWRHAPLSIEGLSLDPKDGPIAEQMLQRFDIRQYRMDLTQAPLLRFAIAQDVDGRWLLLELSHHLIGDNSSMKLMEDEVQALMTGQSDTLPVPQPFRNLVAQTRLKMAEDAHDGFFAEMLAKVEEPTLPFGLTEVYRDDVQITQSHRTLSQDLNNRLRIQARRLSVSLASLCHLAWARVLARASGQQQVVFGTVLFGRMQGGAGADRALGLFINTLPICINLDEASVEDSVHDTHARLAALLEHEHASLALAQRCSNAPAGTPLFSSLLNYRHNTTSIEQNRIMPGIEWLHAEERTHYPFVLSVDDASLGLGLTAQVAQPFDPSRICGYMQEALQSLVEALECTPKMPAHQLEVLPLEERELLLKTWNTTTPYPAPQCIHQLFEEQVERTPEATALVYEDQAFSYAELNAQANRLAHQLIECGVQPDTRVAICVERSPTMVVGLLAILKAGGAYVPLDPVYSSERLKHILTDAAPVILLADAAGRAALEKTALASLTVLDPNDLPPSATTNPQRPSLTPRHLAYVIYTSGSTGVPKGVMVEHAQLTRLFDATATSYQFNQQDVWCLFHSFAFDFSVWEIWGALRHGGKLVIVPHHITRSPQDFYRLLCEQSVTVLNQTPSAFKPLIDCQAQSELTDNLRYVIFGGEPLEPSILQTWYATRSEHSPQLVNMYGITETTVHVTYRPIQQKDSAQVGSPIGKRIADLKIYLLDANRQPVPLGAVGELYIGGAGVARGYLNQSELTAERFPIDPFTDMSDARMYKTGDLARYLVDGNLEFLGRNDFQVKIRGFRIELGEIEARLTEHPQVYDAVVLALGEGSDKRLIAYVVAEPDEQLTQTLRTHLATKLPGYMVPAAFVCLDAFPLTANGKLERKALPAPDSEAFAHQAYEAPQGEIEHALAAIWSELLGVERISRHDNFFALGGHSLMAVRMIERLRHTGLALSVRALFDKPTLSVLAQSLGQHQEIEVPPNRITTNTIKITPELLPLIELTEADIDRIVKQTPDGVENIQDIYALSPLQDGILFHHLMATEGDPYLGAVQMAFANRALLERYLEAVQQVVKRHDILRTAFVWEHLSTPAQVVWRHATLSIEELSLDSANGSIAKQLLQRFDPRRYRIVLTRAPLLHFTIAQDDDGRWLLLRLMHHLIDDHSTFEAMEEEVRALLEGQSDTLLPPQPYRNLVAQARLGVSQETHERFFTKMLAEVDEPTLPFGLSEVHRDGSEVTESHLMLPQNLSYRLRAQAKRLNVSLASVCHLAWAQVLARTSGQQRVVFGTVLFGRMQGGASVNRALGLFINTLPLRVDLDQKSVEENIRNVHASLAALLEHEHASLALAQRCSGVSAGAPLFSALLNYRHNAKQLDEGQILPGVELLYVEERTNYPFTLAVDDFGNTLDLTAKVMQPLDPARVCVYMQQALQSLLKALEHSPEMPTWQLEVLPDAERKYLLETRNATITPYPEYQSIHQLFEAQVERTPQATALIYKNQSLSYAELNTRANRLAHQLIALGAQPDERVALCVERSPAIVIGLLAILKAGAAYLPLDPIYPSERLTQILTDAAPSILLADTAGRAALCEANLSWLTVLDPNNLYAAPITNPTLSLASHHLAYVIYTSGSTGAPKGVMVEHRSLLNLYSALASTVFTHYPVNARVALNASFAFDSSLKNLLSLLNGCTLVIVSEETRTDGAALIQFLETTKIDVLDCTPTQLEILLSTGLLKHESALTLLVGGESISARTWQALLDNPQFTVYNVYGPTEYTVDATIARLSANKLIPTIGQPITNTRLYLLDTYNQLVPLGTVGEIYISGAGIARGYLNQSELTAERFLADPFSNDKNARMYKTGDLARYLPDGNLEFLGRNDHQVKIRGFRIEPGEIETRLAEHPQVHEAVVLTLSERGDKRLVAYVVAKPDEQLAQSLRAYIAANLPEYMVPAAFVRLDALPLTLNGKLDRKALPAPDNEAFAHQAYEAPQGEIEHALAAIWSELLGVERISRHDNFFALGGHSLMAVRMIERLRHTGLALSVRALFDKPTLSLLAQSLRQHQEVAVPPNLIKADVSEITPDLLPLIQLTQADIDRIVEQTPGGIANIQDIYALSPLQDGILFHHLMANEGDPYLGIGQMAFANRVLLDRYLDAVQRVVNRHDILRTAFVWEQLSTPAQVVWRHAPLSIEEFSLDSANGAIAEQLLQRFDPRRHRVDLKQAPLLRFAVAQDENGRWLLIELSHHLIGDNSSMKIMEAEVRALLEGQRDTLPAPQPFRNLVAQARLGINEEAHQHFFKEMLAEVDEPTLPFGLGEVHREGFQVKESRQILPQNLNGRLRVQAKRLGVSLASLCHLAWAQVLARASGQQRVVFGTVLFGRMQGGIGADQVMGLFINTLPLRIDVDETSVEECVAHVHARLAALLEHEHASLALAQRCSGISAGAPLFSALLNYRHNATSIAQSHIMSGIEWLHAEERTNYPFVLSVDDFGTALSLNAQIVQPIDPARVCSYMQEALQSLAQALEHSLLNSVQNFPV